MAAQIADFSKGSSSRFQTIVDVFLSGPGLPFAGILSAARIDRIFAKHVGLVMSVRKGASVRGE